MKILFALFGFILIFQCACASKTESTSVSEIQKAELEAQKLIENGIKFDFTVNSDGVTGDGGFYTGHGHKSSDGFEIGTQVGVYKKEENAKKCFEDALNESSVFLKRESTPDKTGERFVAISKGNGFFGGKFITGKIEKNLCRVYFSSSLKHLLAFEKWRDRN